MRFGLKISHLTYFKLDMPRHSKEHNELVKPLPKYRYENKAVQGYMDATSRLLTSALGSNGKRRRKYVDELTQSLANLCVSRVSLKRLLERHDDLEDRYSIRCNKISDLLERVRILQHENCELSKFRTDFGDMRQQCYTNEEDYGTLLSENTELERKYNQEKRKHNECKKTYNLLLSDKLEKEKMYEDRIRNLEARLLAKASSSEE